MGLHLINIFIAEFLPNFQQRKEERKEVVFPHFRDFPRFGGLGP